MLKRHAAIAAALVVAAVFSCATQRATQRTDATYDGSTARPRYALKRGDDVERELMRFAIIGDFGIDSSAEAQVAKLIKSWSPQFVITTGDNNYPLGLSMTIDRNIGKYFSDYIGHYAGSYGKGSTENRFWPSPGNHDWYSPQGLNPYVEYFTLPGNERYYDVDLGHVHLFALDSDEREPDGVTSTSVQAMWLREKLAASRACFKVVYFHHPPYTSGAHGNTVKLQWPFKAWGADLVVTGHDHTYERIVVDGFPYIVNGIGGAPLYPFKDVLKESVFRYNDGAGAQLVVVTARAMTLQLRDVSDRVLDELKLVKDCASPPAPELDQGDGGVGDAGG